MVNVKDIDPVIRLAILAKYMDYFIESYFEPGRLSFDEWYGPGGPFTFADLSFDLDL